MRGFTWRRHGAIVGVSALVCLTAPAAFAGQAKPSSAPPVRVGGDIKPPIKIKDGGPVIYPPEARRAKMQGSVIIDATIGPDGKVVATKVVRSIPMLDEAAVKAVKEREYRPTTVNGMAISIIVTVPINFTLQ